MKNDKGDSVSSFNINELQVNTTTWKVQVIALRVGPLQQFNGSRGPGKLCKFILADKEGTRIQAVAFDEVAGNLKQEIKKHKMYILTNGVVRQPNKNYESPHPSLELLLNNETTVEEENIEITLQPLFKQFKPISTILGQQTQASHDLLGVVVAVKPLITWYRKSTGEKSQKRDIIIVDEAKTSTTITLWEEEASNEGKHLEDIVKELPVVALTDVQKTTYEGRDEVSMTKGISTIIINPKIEAAEELKKSFENRDEFLEVSKNLERSKKVALEELLEDHNIVELDCFCRFEARIIPLDNLDYPFYNACKKCNRKVTFDKVEGLLKCGNCTEEKASYQPKYMVRLTASGEEKTAKLTLFEEAAEQIIGCKAKEFLQSQEKDKLTSPHYIKLVETKGKMYTFVIKKDKKNGEAISTGSMTVKEVYNLKKSRRNEANDGQANNPFLNKKIKIEKE